MTRRTLQKIHDIYLQAAGEVSQIVVISDLQGLSDFTSNAWRQIQLKLEHYASVIEADLGDRTQLAMASVAERSLLIHEDFLIDLVDITNGTLTESGIIAMFAGVDDRIVTSLVSRVYESGYTFSKRVWNVADQFQTQIKDVISVGVAMNRDVFDIAKDLEVYVKFGRRGLAKRYGGLIKGTREWSKRIRKDIDFNALRLIRSELYNSLQETAKIGGQMNPGCTGLYDWKRNTSEDWHCSCPEYEKNSPYTLDALPGYPHPNCLCEIIARLRDLRTFASDLKRWGNGDDIPYIQDWHDKYYISA
jgi:hypothetical protein